MTNLFNHEKSEIDSIVILEAFLVRPFPTGTKKGEPKTRQANSVPGQKVQEDVNG